MYRLNYSSNGNCDRLKDIFIFKPCEVLTTAAVTENIARASIGRKLRLNPSKVHNINYIGSTLGSERINAHELFFRKIS